MGGCQSKRAVKHYTGAGKPASTQSPGRPGTMDTVLFVAGQGAGAQPPVVGSAHMVGAHDDSVRVPAVHDDAAPAPAATHKKRSKKNFVWRTKDDDFAISREENKTIVKTAGWISGDAMTIADCKNIDLYVFDFIDSVQMDACHNCRVFLGAVEGSIFIRDCVNCKFELTCQQLRVRDSCDLELSLLCTTQPIIEQSERILFKCIQASYEGMAEHMGKAKLQVFNNTWKDIFDFSDSTGKNFGFLTEHKTGGVVPVPAENPASLSYARETSTMPLISAARTAGQTTFLILCGAALKESDAFVRAFQGFQADTLHLLRSMDIVLETGRFSDHLRLSPDEKGRMREAMLDGAEKQRIIAMELCGTGGHAHVATLVQTLSPQAQRHVICMTAGGVQRAAAFFTLVTES